MANIPKKIKSIIKVPKPVVDPDEPATIDFDYLKPVKHKEAEIASLNFDRTDKDVADMAEKEAGADKNFSNKLKRALKPRPPPIKGGKRFDVSKTTVASSKIGKEAAKIEEAEEAARRRHELADKQQRDERVNRNAEFNEAAPTQLARLCKGVIRDFVDRAETMQQLQADIDDLEREMARHVVENTKLVESKEKLERLSSRAEQELETAEANFEEADENFQKAKNKEETVEDKKLKFEKKQETFIRHWTDVTENLIVSKNLGLVNWNNDFTRISSLFSDEDKKVSHTKECAEILQQKMRKLEYRIEKNKIDVESKDHRIELMSLQAEKKILYYRNKLDNSFLNSHITNLVISRDVKYEQSLHLRREIRRRLVGQLERSNALKTICHELVNENTREMLQLSIEWHRSGFNPLVYDYIHSQPTMLRNRRELKQTAVIYVHLRDNVDENQKAYHRLCDRLLKFASMLSTQAAADANAYTTPQALRQSSALQKKLIELAKQGVMVDEQLE